MQHTAQMILLEGLLPEQQRELTDQTVRLINAIFPKVLFPNWAMCERYLPQAKHGATLITRFQLTSKEGVLLLERLTPIISYPRRSY